MEEPGGLPSMGSHRVRHDWSDLAAAAACSKYLHILIHLILITTLGGYQSLLYHSHFMDEDIKAKKGQIVSSELYP